MEHVYSSTKDECLFIDPNLEEDHEEDAPLFLNFPSPFFDEFSAILIPENKHIHQQHKQLNISEPSPSPSPLPSETKRLNKRSTGKRDRHSKIYTAQGLRDRRMRLSLHIARKFFDLQDLLGFDKASETIEWLFCKSNKAIKEVAENFNPQQTNYQSSSEEIRNEIKVATNKPDKSKEDEIKNKKYSRKQIRNNYSIKETRDQARARARDRTRKRLMIKELEKSNQFFRGNPKDEFHKLGLGLGLGYLMSPNNHNSQSEPMQQELLSSHSFEQYSSTTHHLLQDLQSATVDVNSFVKYSGSIVGATTYCNHNPPAGWLNSSDGFLRVPGELDADSFVTDYCNYGIVPTIGHMTGDIYEQNPSSFFMSTTTNILHFQSQNQGK